MGSYDLYKNKVINVLVQLRKINSINIFMYVIQLHFNVRIAIDIQVIHFKRYVYFLNFFFNTKNAISYNHKNSFH